MKWEYQHIELDHPEASRDSAEELNRYGDAGWELVSAYPQGAGRLAAIFKRVKAEKPRPGPLVGGPISGRRSRYME